MTEIKAPTKMHELMQASGKVVNFPRPDVVFGPDSEGWWFLHQFASRLDYMALSKIAAEADRRVLANSKQRDLFSGDGARAGTLVKIREVLEEAYRELEGDFVQDDTGQGNFEGATHHDGGDPEPEATQPLTPYGELKAWIYAQCMEEEDGMLAWKSAAGDYVPDDGAELDYATVDGMLNALRWTEEITVTEDSEDRFQILTPEVAHLVHDVDKMVEAQPELFGDEEPEAIDFIAFPEPDFDPEAIVRRVRAMVVESASGVTRADIIEALDGEVIPEHIDAALTELFEANLVDLDAEADPPVYVAGEGVETEEEDDDDAFIADEDLPYADREAVKAVYLAELGEEPGSKRTKTLIEAIVKARAERNADPDDEPFEDDE